MNTKHASDGYNQSLLEGSLVHESTHTNSATLLVTLQPHAAVCRAGLVTLCVLTLEL